MGMFDKDKEIGLLLTNLFQRGEQFILWSAEVVRDDYPTDLGMATQSRLSVSRIASPGERYDVTTLASAIGAKVREAEADDFPAVVFWTQAPSRYGGEATVLQFVKPWGNQTQERQAAPQQVGEAPQGAEEASHG